MSRIDITPTKQNKAYVAAFEAIKRTAASSSNAVIQTHHCIGRRIVVDGTLDWETTKDPRISALTLVSTDERFLTQQDPDFTMRGPLTCAPQSVQQSACALRAR